MIRVKKVLILLFAIVFILITVGVGFISFTNLVKFYVNDEVDYNEWTADLGNKFETDVATTFFEKFEFINLNGVVRNILGQREMNGITKLNNGHLIKPQAKKSEEEIKICADEVIKYAEFCKKQGKLFLYVQPNLKVDEDNKQLPAGVEDYSNENINAFLDYLKDAELEVLDIRECMKNDGMDLYDYTYVTDHHWTTGGCFYAFTQIADWIDNKYGVEADARVVNIDNYEIKTYPEWHLGSYGQRTGQYFAGIDDYELIIPTFDVEFTTSDGEEHSFYESAVNAEEFEERDVTSRYTYDRGLERPEGVATTSRDLNLLFISDSYVTGMEPYLKLAYSDYDYQYYPNGFSADYVIEKDPDIVILMPYYTSTFHSGALFYDMEISQK